METHKWRSSTGARGTGEIQDSRSELQICCCKAFVIFTFNIRSCVQQLSKCPRHLVCSHPGFISRVASRLECNQEIILNGRLLGASIQLCFELGHGKQPQLLLRSPPGWVNSLSGARFQLMNESDLSYYYAKLHRVYTYIPSTSDACKCSGRVGAV